MLSRSSSSSSLASGRPIATALTRAQTRPAGVRGWLAAAFATRRFGPAYRKYGEWGRSTRTRRSAGFRPVSGRRPPITGPQRGRRAGSGRRLPARAPLRVDRRAARRGPLKRAAPRGPRGVRRRAGRPGGRLPPRHVRPARWRRRSPDRHAAAPALAGSGATWLAFSGWPRFQRRPEVQEAWAGSTARSAQRALNRPQEQLIRAAVKPRGRGSRRPAPPQTTRRNRRLAPPRQACGEGGSHRREGNALPRRRPGPRPHAAAVPG